MRAAVFHGKDDIRLEDVPDPTCGPDEVLLTVHATGICGTDAHEFASGPHMPPLHDRHPFSGHQGPMILGHELTGVVREVGAQVRGSAPGDLVVTGAGISCGECGQCRRGRTNLCTRYYTIGLHRDGGLAQLCTVPAATCLQVAPYGLTADAATLAQPMSIAVHSMRRGRLQPNEHAVIVGAGGIGAFLTYAATSVTDRVAVLDIDDERLRIATNLRAAHALRLGDGIDPAAAVADWALEPDVVYEVSGTRAGLETALSLLPPGGRLVLVGLQGEPVPMDVRRIALAELEVIGPNAHVCSADLPTALELLAARDGPWDDVAPIALSLDDLVEEGLRPLAERRSTRIKTIVDPSAPTTRPTQMRHADA
jgi:(R,R)-butanediol dehydrogenase / meso-butanediol dehydrogenase / diacetyl reductase